MITFTALCKLCNTNIIADNEINLSVFMLAHILQEHSRHEKYEPLIKKIIDTMEEDFTVSFSTKLGGRK